uniref:Uncharacterized protein n=1 Tax=Rhizophora mucronata TaxID=61149 RepID=A0A2P2R0X0_RHIMU
MIFAGSKKRTPYTIIWRTRHLHDQVICLV